MSLPFAEDLDISEAHVQAPSKVVFLCGGQCSNLGDPPLSLRDAFLKISTSPIINKLQLIQAEEITRGALFFEHYRDFFEFENDLAQITELILLFCEGFGSLAELGAFSRYDETAKRLLVIIRDHHWDEDSFVKLGPLRFLENNYSSNSVFVIDDLHINIVDDNYSNVDINLLKGAMEEPLKARLLESTEPSSFDADRSGHIIKLIVGFIQEYGALTLPEIVSLLSQLSLDADERKVSAYLLCAKAVEWIQEKRSGSETFFVAKKFGDAVSSFIKADVKDKNKLRRRSVIRDHWKKTHPSRHRAIRAIYDGGHNE